MRTGSATPPTPSSTRRSPNTARPRSNSASQRMDQLDVNLALTLLMTERYAAVEKLARRGESSTTWKALRIAAVAAGQGLRRGLARGAAGCPGRRRPPCGTGGGGRVSRPDASLSAGGGHARSGGRRGAGRGLKRRPGRWPACDGSPKPRWPTTRRGASSRSCSWECSRAAGAAMDCPSCSSSRPRRATWPPRWTSFARCCGLPWRTSGRTRSRRPAWPTCSRCWRLRPKATPRRATVFGPTTRTSRTRLGTW